MSGNNGYERKKFNEEQARLKGEYHDAGMTEEQIEDIHQFDLGEFNNTRRYYEHNMQIPDNIFTKNDEGLCPLNDKFLEVMSVTNEQSDAKSRYWWIEEIDNPQLAKELKGFSSLDIEIITLYVFKKYTQSEISEILGIDQSTVCRHLDAKKNILEKFLKRA